MKVSQDGQQSPPDPSRTLNMGPHQHVLRVARAAVSGLMGSVDDVWLYVFFRGFLNTLARDTRLMKVFRRTTAYNKTCGQSMENIPYVSYSNKCQQKSPIFRADAPKPPQLINFFRKTTAHNSGCGQFLPLLSI